MWHSQKKHHWEREIIQLYSLWSKASSSQSGSLLDASCCLLIIRLLSELVTLAIDPSYPTVRHQFSSTDLLWWDLIKNRHGLCHNCDKEHLMIVISHCFFVVHSLTNSHHHHLSLRWQFAIEMAHRNSWFTEAKSGEFPSSCSFFCTFTRGQV